MPAPASEFVAPAPGSPAPAPAPGSPVLLPAAPENELCPGAPERPVREPHIPLGVGRVLVFTDLPVVAGYAEDSQIIS